jgi:hypothetical protein
MSLAFIQQQIDHTVMHYHGIKHLWLFGSTAKGTSHADSDIDFVYEYDPQMDQSFASIYGLYPILEEQFGAKIDLASIDQLQPNVKDEILSSMISIF